MQARSAHAPRATHRRRRQPVGIIILQQTPRAAHRRRALLTGVANYSLATRITRRRRLITYNRVFVIMGRRPAAPALSRMLIV